MTAYKQADVMCGTLASATLSWRAMPDEGGFFALIIHAPDRYPHEAPKVRLQTTGMKLFEVTLRSDSRSVPHSSTVRRYQSARKQAQSDSQSACSLGVFAGGNTVRFGPNLYA